MFPVCCVLVVHVAGLRPQLVHPSTAQHQVQCFSATCTPKFGGLRSALLAADSTSKFSFAEVTSDHVAQNNRQLPLGCEGKSPAILCHMTSSQFTPSTPDGCPTEQRSCGIPVLHDRTLLLPAAQVPSAGPAQTLTLRHPTQLGPASSPQPMAQSAPHPSLALQILPTLQWLSANLVSTAACCCLPI
jgi:hypothetical protein